MRYGDVRTRTARSLGASVGNSRARSRSSGRNAAGGFARLERLDERISQISSIIRECPCHLNFY